LCEFEFPSVLCLGPRLRRTKAMLLRTRRSPARVSIRHRAVPSLLYSFAAPRLDHASCGPVDQPCPYAPIRDACSLSTTARRTLSRLSAPDRSPDRARDARDEPRFAETCTSTASRFRDDVNELMRRENRASSNCSLDLPTRAATSRELVLKASAIRTEFHRRRTPIRP